MASDQAYVTLATNDSYGLGALVLGSSLRNSGTSRKLAILITPEVSHAMRSQLSQVFDVVEVVDVLDSKDSANLTLLERPELGVTLTKLHAWNLTQFSKAVFLDADALVLSNVDELFEREELSAVPDVGWPDCFNTGVFVFRPNPDTYQALVNHAREHGSFDGGDQGLLNSYFSSWHNDDIKKHLSFIYNMVATAIYSYAPAFKQYGSKVKIVHFLGNAKPWHHTSGTSGAFSPALGNYLQLWWQIFNQQVRGSLQPGLTGLAGRIGQTDLGSTHYDRRIGGSSHTEQHRESSRRDWESGNIDYLGADRFENIQRRIETTIQKSGVSRVSPPKDQGPTAVDKAKDAVSTAASNTGAAVSGVAVAAGEAAKTVAHKAGEVVSKTGETVVDVASSAGHAAAEVASSAGHAAKTAAVDVGEAVSDVASAAGHTIVNTASNVGGAVSDVASAAGHTIVDAASNVASAAGSVASTVGEKMTDAAATTGHVIHDASSAVGGAMTNVAAATGHVVADAASHVGEAGVHAAQAVSHAKDSIITNVASGLISAMEGVASVVGAVKDKVADVIHPSAEHDTVQRDEKGVIVGSVDRPSAEQFATGSGGSPASQMASSQVTVQPAKPVQPVQPVRQPSVEKVTEHHVSSVQVTPQQPRQVTPPAQAHPTVTTPGMTGTYASHVSAGAHPDQHAHVSSSTTITTTTTGPAATRPSPPPQGSHSSSTVTTTTTGPAHGEKKPSPPPQGVSQSSTTITTSSGPGAHAGGSAAVGQQGQQHGQAGAALQQGARQQTPPVQGAGTDARRQSGPNAQHPPK